MRGLGTLIYPMKGPPVVKEHLNPSRTDAPQIHPLRLHRGPAECQNSAL